MTFNLNNPEGNEILDNLGEGANPISADKVFRALLFYATRNQAADGSSAELPTDANYILSELVNATIKLFTGHDSLEYRNHGQVPPRYEDLIWKDYGKLILGSDTYLDRTVEDAITYLVYPHECAMFGIHNTNLDLHYRTNTPIIGKNRNWKKQTKYFRQICRQWMDKTNYFGSDIRQTIDDEILIYFTRTQDEALQGIGHVMSLYLAKDLEHLKGKR